MLCSQDVLMPGPSSEDSGVDSALGGRSLSMPLSLDMTEKRLMSEGEGSQGHSPSSGSSCSWRRGKGSDSELDRNHLASSRPADAETQPQRVQLLT